MTDQTTTTPELLEDLDQAYQGSYYFIAGAGGDLSEWTEGYEKLLREQEIGTPSTWYRTVGAAVNRYAERRGGFGFQLDKGDDFQDDLTILLFPLDGLHPGRLAMFKLAMQDRWFDDVVDNMVRRGR